MKPAALLLLAARVALGALFVVSGFGKLTAPAANFAAVIEKFELVQGPPAQILARTLPWIEFVAGVLFALGLWTRASLAALWAMNTMFLFVLGQALARKLPIEQCGCFGEAVTMSPQQMLWIDAALWAVFLVFFLSWRRVRPLSLDDRL